MKDSDDLQRGRESYGRRAWADAHELLSRADRASPLGAEDLERLAWSAGLAGHDEALVATLERLYQTCLDAGEAVRAAHWAFWAGFRLLGTREHGRASGWLSRAQRLLEHERVECVMEGYLLLPAIFRQLRGGEHDAAYAAATRAAEIGERFGERNLIAFARNLQGRALLGRGCIQEGLALLDEVMLTVTAGELSPIVTGLIYCSVIAGCHQVYALSRTREWTAALASWCDAQPQLVSFTGSCLVHRAEIMQLGGDWAQSIEEARRACTGPGGAGLRDAAGDGFYQQAEILRLRGDFAAAEEAYRSASQLGREPQPGLALLRLAQGQGEAAATAIRRVAAAAADPMQRIRVLPACVEIQLALDELDGARSACGELEKIAAQFDTEVLGAVAAHARGAVLLAEGDAKRALEPLGRAFRIWQQVGAPYIAARIRVLLGRACRALGDDDGAKLAFDAARSVFERLGAAPDVAMLDALENEKRKAPSSHGLTPRELEVIRLVAAGKTNKVIARELYLSEKTVDRHVSNIFTKLNVASRAAATAYAYEHQLI